MEEGPHRDKFVSDSLTDGGFFFMSRVGKRRNENHKRPLWKHMKAKHYVQEAVEKPIPADQMGGDSACKSIAISQKCTSHTH